MIDKKCMKAEANKQKQAVESNGIDTISESVIDFLFSSNKTPSLQGFKEAKEDSDNDTEADILRKLTSLSQIKAELEELKTQRITEVLTLIEAIITWHQYGGEGYEATLMLLKSYRKWMSVIINNETAHDIIDRIIEELGGEEMCIFHGYGKCTRTFLGDTTHSRINLYQIVKDKDDEEVGVTAKSLMKYFSTTKISIVAATCRIMEIKLNVMGQSKEKKIKAYAQMLKVLYFDEETEDVLERDLYEKFGYSKDTFTKKKREAISYFSILFFGPTPGEYISSKITFAGGKLTFENVDKTGK